MSDFVMNFKLSMRRLNAWVTMGSLVAASAIVSACEAARDTETIEVYGQPGYEEAWQQFRATVRSSGGNVLIADGDLYFRSEDELRAYFDESMKAPVEKAHKFVRLSTGADDRFTTTNAVSITFCVSDAFGSSKLTWASRVLEATRAWETVANVNFIYDSSKDASCSQTTSFVDFAVIRVDSLGGYCAANKMTWNTTVGPGGCPLDILGLTIAKGVLVIDPLQDMTYGGEVPFVTPVGALRHELGHMLGLRHEHPWRGGVFDPSCAELPTEPAADTTGAQIGSKAYDRESVMHYPFNSVATRLCGGITTSSLNLSATDKADIQLLYGMTPALVAVITQPLNE